MLAEAVRCSYDHLGSKIRPTQLENGWTTEKQPKVGGTIFKTRLSVENSQCGIKRFVGIVPHQFPTN